MLPPGVMEARHRNGVTVGQLFIPGVISRAEESVCLWIDSPKYQPCCLSNQNGVQTAPVKNVVDLEYADNIVFEEKAQVFLDELTSHPVFWCALCNHKV
ncbi:hypothetical protein T265_04363 [Opisthorchis viverrini]|uniref:Uncharacterized protein n=1 Tax=Opisthorchis viverrini TaxID=6198 RepID=A0A075AGN5_OPIVI|nr:hypothetical protein T265_04363 [Opisthorchis viverrini]KER28899.1 hypothetical protein T265_04363 [Opisthorchis viverrini]